MQPFTTPDLYDEYSSQVQVADAGLQHFGGKTSFSGQAITIHCPNDNSLVGTLVRTNGQGKVLIVDANNSKQFAFLGDNLAKLALENNWQGIVVNGCVRDIEILTTLPIAIMALGSTPRKTVKEGLGSKVNALSFLSTTICNNDWVYGDLNGLLISKKPLINAKS